MRKVIFFLIIILSLPTVLWATDPIIGTWKYNKEKSNTPLLIEETQIFKEVGKDKIEFTRFCIFESGDRYNEKYTYPRQGGVVVFEGKRVGVELFIKPGEWYYVTLKGKEDWGFIQRIISKDGKTMNVTYKGYVYDGSYSEFKQVFEKQ